MLKLTFKEFCKLCVEQPEINSTLLDFANDVAEDKNFPKIAKNASIEEQKEEINKYFKSLDYNLCDAAKDAFLHLWTVYSVIDYSLKQEPVHVEEV